MPRVFTATLFTVAKAWEQPKCPSTEARIKRMWNIYTMNIRDFNGNVLYSTDVIAKHTRRFTNVTGASGFNFADDLMEDGWKQIADKVGAFFISELKFKIKGPKGDENFDADDVTIYVDG